MSLHLIESRKLPIAATRKRGGTMASVLIHALLVLGVFTLATASPLPIPRKVEQPTIYVDPVPEQQAPPKAPATAPLNSHSSVPTLPSLDVPLVPVDMPVPNYNIVSDQLPTSPVVFSGRRVGGLATDGDSCCDKGPPGRVFTDLQVDKPVMLLAGARAPRYPEALRTAGVQDTVLATFVVDTLGRVEAGSFEVTNAPNALFVAAVRESLTSTHFKPAEAQGRAVRQRVNQAFVFSLTR